MNTLSSHVLDTTNGRPASAMKLTLTAPNGQQVTNHTNQDGRCKDWAGINFEAGIYTLRFHTQDYLLATHGESFYPHVDVCFTLAENGGHYHVPLLISPYGFSSYRGS